MGDHYEKQREEQGSLFPKEELGLNLKDLLVGDVNRLRYIVRFGTALTLHKENVAEHSYYVAIYAYFIAQWVKAKTDIQLDMFRIQEACLFHDLEESRTGDFPRPFKYRRKELKEQLDWAASDEFVHIISNLLPGDTELLSHLSFIWDTARDETVPEGCIVALADYLSVISHLWQEVNSSNASMYYHYESVMEYLKTFDHPTYDFMRPIVNEVGEITRAVFDRSNQEKLNLEK